MDTVVRKWHVLMLLFCTPSLHCVELCAQPYVEPANEFVVADTAATETHIAHSQSVRTLTMSLCGRIDATIPELAAIYTPRKLTLTKSFPSALSPAHRPETIE